MGDRGIGSVVEAIRDYLTRHPEAADSPEGIARCWLSGSVVDASVSDVHAALERLIEQGIVSARRLPDGGQIYGAAAAKRAH